jgi:hypothetical protein
MAAEPCRIAQAASNKLDNETLNIDNGVVLIAATGNAKGCAILVGTPFVRTRF